MPRLSDSSNPLRASLRRDLWPRLARALRGWIVVASVLLAALPAHAVDDELTEYVTIPAGSYIVDMGVSPQTVANALKPYGLVYDLVKNYRVPVLWSINPAKAKDGIDFGSYRGGPFIIDATYVTPAIVAVINTWRARGVVIDGPTAAPIAGVPIYDSITGLANLVLDFASGSIAAGFLTAAGVPSTAYSYKSPFQLNTCDDIFVMPHADPTWATHRNLIDFVKNKGYVWSGCHAVSVLENIDDPSTPTVNPDMNFLSLTGLVPFGSHGDGSPPYTSILPSDPVMQFLGTTDAAQQGGSEQVFLPKLGGGWRPGTKVLVYDTSQADIPSKSAGPAAAIVHGRAYDNPFYGRVMYEGGHNVGGTAPANIAAQRAFLNFWMLALVDRRPDVAVSISASSVGEGSSVSLSSTVNNAAGGVTYQWVSSAGGTFSAPNSPTTTFTPPEVPAATQILIRLIVTDACGRNAFAVVPVQVTNVAKADLAITKTDSADPVAVGQNFNYVLSVANLGTDPATSVVVEDTLPAGVTFVGASGDGWTCGFAAGKVTCTRPTLALTGSTPSTITITVTAPGAATTLTNTATVTSALTDLNPGNNSATQPTTVQAGGVDVAVTKTAPAGPFYAGQSFDYTLAVQNASLLPATSLTVTDVLPAGPPGLTFVSASGSGWNCIYSSPDRTVTCHRPLLAAGAVSNITLRVTPSGTGTIANTATVSSPDFVDQNLANNTSTVNITVAAPADLAISKTGSTTGGGGGQVDTFVVTLTNNGPGTATGVTVTDVMSGNGLTKYTKIPGCSLVASTGTLSPASPWPVATLQAGGTWSIPSMAAGASATLTLTCIGDNNDGVRNVASVTSTSFDPNSSNNQASAYVVQGGTKNGDIQILKASNPSTVLAGGSVTYRITVNNLGTEDANDLITVTDTLPAGSTYVGFANVAGGGTWNCTHSAGVVTCTTNSDLKKLTGSPNTLFFDITVTAPSATGTMVNTASVSYVWDKNDVYDPLQNNTATATTNVIFASTDIAVAKTVSNAQPAVGSNVVFTITASNVGPNAASNLRLTDLLPAGLSYVSGTPSQGSYDRVTGLWYVGNLASGASATLTITATVGFGAANNTACLYAVDQTDTNPANNCATAAVTIQYADLALSKTVSSATANVNSTVNFTVTLLNNGPSAVSAVTVQDVLPAGLDFVSATASVGTYSATTGQWTLPGPLASGASATLTLTARVMVANLLLTNTASIAASGLPDTNTSNNSASASVTGQSADIQVAKVVDISTPPALNTNLTFTVSVRNNGPSAATNVVVTDLLPAGLAYQSHTASQGSYVSGSGVWSLGGLAPYNSGTGTPVATLTLVARNTAFGNLTNTAAKTSLDQYDPDTTNDSASVSVLSGGSADLEVTKIVDLPDIAQGGQATFTVRLRNLGPNPATGVVVTDALPAGLAYVSSVASQGSYNSGTGQWSVGNVAVGQTITLNLVAIASVAGVHVNTAAVSALNQADPDPTNNSASTSVNAQPAADLAITKSGPTSAPLSSVVTYTIVARNNGPSSVTGATISDSVPAQITGVTWNCVANGTSDCSTVGAGTGASGTGNAITLSSVKLDPGAGNTLTITVTGTASATGTAVNTAIISPPANNTVFDPNVANNSATVTTVISNVLLTGRVFADTGTGGGAANDGIFNGGELGIAKVTVRLTDCGNTTYATSTTGGDGTYGLAIPVSLAPGTTLCVVQTNLTGYVSTGAQVGNTGGSYDRTGDRVQFTLAANVTYANINFGDVPDNRFLTDGSKTALPGATVSHPHIFIAGTGGQVTFTTVAAASPAMAGWTEVLYLDTNCDGILGTPTDQPLSGPVTVTEGQRICLIQQQFVPGTAAVGASNLVSVIANFVYTGASPALLGTYTRQDLTTVSSVALGLQKEVRNVTQNGPWVLSNQARAGEELEYRITYRNNGATPIADLVVRDMTPAYTVFISAQCVAPLPASLTSCVVSAPAALSAGALQWQFVGSLASGTSGVVTYRVKVQ